MPQPKVSVVTLTNGSRPLMLARLIQSIKAQTYQNVEHIIFDTSAMAGKSIGVMRNAANAMASGDLIAHGDDDDYSHPLRLAEQVDYLQSSGRAVVGYNEMLFWDTSLVSMRHTTTPRGKFDLETCVPAREAWLYTNANPAQPLGTSLLYTAAAWEHCRFADLTRPHTGRSAGGEDTDFLARQLRPMPRAVSSVYLDPGMARGPRMIASLHGENTSSKITHNVPEWRRVPEWDAYCRKTMEAAK